MKKLVLGLIVNGISLFLISQLFSGIEIRLDSLLLLTVVFYLLNAIIRPILKILSFPITILTLGLFSFVINGLMLWFAFKMVDGAYIKGFWTCVWASIVISVLNSFLTRTLKE